MSFVVKLQDVYYTKSKQNGNVGARCIVPTEKMGNKMVRAQFIVPLQHNCNQKTIIYFEFVCNTLYKKYFEFFGE